MTIRIRRCEPGDTPAIERLNARLAAHGVPDRVYPEGPSQPSERRGDPLTQELHIAVDGDEVRGGVWLHEHEFVLSGQTVRAGWLKYPVAESLIDRAWSGVPAALIVSLMRRLPDLMALGMGSAEAPIARLLAGLGWTIRPVPFMVTPTRPSRVFRDLPQLQRHRAAGRVARIAARTGLATLGCLPLTALRAASAAIAARGLGVTEEDRFGDWADSAWERCRGAYPFIARRDAAMLNHLLPAGFPGMTRLRVRRNGADIGWACVTLSRTDTAAQSAYGGLRVGLLADGLSSDDNAAAILAVGIRHLVRQGADLIVINHAHRAWLDPLRRMGFLTAPSNFLFASSKPMSRKLETIAADHSLFLNRGDCDGPPRW